MNTDCFSNVSWHCHDSLLFCKLITSTFTVPQRTVTFLRRRKINVIMSHQFVRDSREIDILDIRVSPDDSDNFRATDSFIIEDLSREKTRNENSSFITTLRVSSFHEWNISSGFRQASLRVGEDQTTTLYAQSFVRFSSKLFQFIKSPSANRIADMQILPRIRVLIACRTFRKI